MRNHGCVTFSHRIWTVVVALGLLAGACTGTDSGDTLSDGGGDTAPEWNPTESLFELDPNDALLTNEDLPDGWSTAGDIHQWDAGEAQLDLARPCGQQIDDELGSEFAATVDLAADDGSLRASHTVLFQDGDIGAEFLSSTIEASGACSSWESDSSRYRLLDAPPFVNRGDGAWAFSMEYELEGERVVSSYFQVRCGKFISRVALHSGQPTPPSATVFDELAMAAYRKLPSLDRPVLRFCNQAFFDAQQRRWRQPALTYQNPFTPLTLRDRPAILNSLADAYVQPTAPALSSQEPGSFWDADLDDDVDLTDIAILVANWVLHPDELASRVENPDIRALLLGARELFDLTPVSGCVTLGLHMIEVMTVEADFELGRLVPCGFAILSKVGASGVQTLRPLGGPRWHKAVDDAVRVLDEANVQTGAELYDRFSTFIDSSAHMRYTQACGERLMALLGTQPRLYCVALPALVNE